MNPSLRPLLAIIFAATIGCQGRTSEPAAPSSVTSSSRSYCEISTESALDVAGRADGIYGVIGEDVGRAPLLDFERMTREAEGAEPNGKPFLWFRLSDKDAKSLHDFTAAPEGRTIAVVVDGRLMSRHKVREPITSSRFQVSCCDARACERLHRYVTAEGAPSGPKQR